MKGHISLRLLAALFAGTALLVTACGKEKREEGKSAESPASNAESAGKIIVVEAYSDAQGNYFMPAKIEAHPGDIVRFTLKSGVHNVNFLADSNPGKTGLPAPSDMLQLPDQTYDLHVSFAKGHYYFQCDPHAALGMKGYLEVED